MLAENLLVEQGWLGTGTAIITGWGIAFVVVMPIGMLYWRWLFRSIERNAPWIDRFAPWAPKAVAAGLALLVAAPTAWAAYAYSRPVLPPPVVVREVVIPPTWLYLDDRGAITTMRRYRELGHACLQVMRERFRRTDLRRPADPACERDDVYELALRIDREMKEQSKTSSERQRRQHHRR